MRSTYQQNPSNYMQSQQQNIGQSAYKFNEKFDDSEEIDDDEISQHEMNAKNMQNRVSSTAKKVAGGGQNESEKYFQQQNRNNYPQMDSASRVLGSKNLNVNEIQFELQKSASERPQAIQLITFHSDSNRMEIGSRAIELLTRYGDNKICFVSIAGLYRSGKSAILNKLLGLKSGEGFRVENSVNACTQGIWMWTNPEYNDREDLYIFFVDSEGLQSMEQSQEHDLKIFTLTMLISSVMIYNSFGGIDEPSINQLALVTKLSKNIAVNEFGEKIDDYMVSHYTPRFIWLLRDFMLELTDSKDKKISANQYLENCLLADGSVQMNGRAISYTSSKTIRKSILAYFKDRACLTMVKPVKDDDQLRNLDRLNLEELRPEFQKQVVALRQMIFQRCQAKSFNGQNLNGRMMCAMIETFVNNINHKDGIPNLHSAWENIVLNESIVGKQLSLQLFESEMKRMLEERETAVDFMELYNNFRVIRDKVIEKYDSIAGIREKNAYYHQYRAELIAHMESREQQAFEKNEDIASVQNDELIKILSEHIKRKIFKEEYTHKNIETYIKEFNEFLEQYDQRAVGMKKAEILISTIHQINDSFVNLLVKSIEKDYKTKQDAEIQDDKYNQKKEQDYKQQIVLLDENIIQYEERIKQQEKQKVQLEQEKDKQQKKLEETRKEVESLQQDSLLMNTYQ